MSVKAAHAKMGQNALIVFAATAAIVAMDTLESIVKQVSFII